ncbi:hypothetical protein [Mycoplasma sp. ATU-Cv-508]|uniref:MHJ_0274 family protein n=1 Tax=Mycoplasma sp. ATU-Cv-508 TaxID=2048001 RepID=UPI000FDF5A99
MWAWIVLGSLLGTVVVFLLISALKDKRKNYVVKKETEKHEALKEHARQLVGIWVEIVDWHNQKLLDQFVPSIGKIRMSEIRHRARTALELLTEKQEFQIMSESEANQDMVQAFEKLRRSNSNNWTKNNRDELKLFPLGCWARN